MSFNADECILWEGCPNTKRSSPSIEVNKVQYPIRRFIYIETWGPIPAHYEVSSFCGVNRCVNVDHLYAADRDTRMTVQSHRGHYDKKKLTHCSRGHPFDETHTKLRKNKKGKVERFCVTCQRAATAKFNRARGGKNYRTAAEIKRDREARTRCVNGHPWTEENTYLHHNVKYPHLSYRTCRTCRKLAARRARERNALHQSRESDNGIQEQRPGTDSET